jgi:hypothetical protein
MIKLRQPQLSHTLVVLIYYVQLLGFHFFFPYFDLPAFLQFSLPGLYQAL